MIIKYCSILNDYTLEKVMEFRSLVLWLTQHIQRHLTQPAKMGAGVSLSKECHLLIKNLTVAKFFLEVSFLEYQNLSSKGDSFEAGRF